MLSIKHCTHHNTGVRSAWHLLLPLLLTGLLTTVYSQDDTLLPALPKEPLPPLPPVPEPLPEVEEDVFLDGWEDDLMYGWQYDFDFDWDTWEPSVSDEYERVLGQYLDIPEEKLEELREKLEHQREKLQEEAVRLSREAQWITRDAQERAAETVRIIQPEIQRYRQQLDSLRKEIARKYQEGYRLILDEQWESARRVLEQFLNEFEKSQYTEPARFWICYSMEKLGLPDEQVFDAYYQFTQDFPRSRWADDAKANLITIGNRLVARNRQLRQKYSPILEQLQQDYDTEVALRALYGLSLAGGNVALGVIAGLYDQSSDIELRKNIISTLRRFDEPAAREKLAEIATNDPDPDLRAGAIRALGNYDSPDVVKLLQDILKNSEDAKIRVQAIHSLQSIGDDEVVPLLLETARNDPHIRVRTEAVSALGRIGTPQAQEALMKILQGD